jgi:gamma-glutamylcyclotransferase (GGCT)/AIG2-like uncharacterized protein YtfP
MLTPEQEANVAHHVFVYGTLKRGECNHGFLARFQGVSAQAEGIVLHAGPCYPYAVRGEDTASGEVTPSTTLPSPSWIPWRNTPAIMSAN